MASAFVFKPFVTNPVASIDTGIIIHFRFNTHCLSIRLLLYFNFFLLPFAQHFCLQALPHLSVRMFSLFVFNYYIWPICCNFSVCVYRWIPQQCNIFLFIHWLGRVCVCVCVLTFCMRFKCLGLCKLSNANLHTFYRVSLLFILRQNGAS